MNAVIYARYSSHGQNEQSIEGQLHDNYDFAERDGYTVIETYIDRAKSGTTDERAEFKRMISDAARKQFQVVIVWKLDRFARNRYDSAIYKSMLKRYGIRVVSAKENLTDTPEGIILEGMLEALAEYYSANLSVNVKRGIRETLAKGRFNGGKIPYGYKLSDGKLIADERTAWVVRYLYEQYAAGVPKKQIIDALREKGVKSPNGQPLITDSFQTVFKSTVYYGELIRNGTVVKDCAEPIITKELYDQVQKRINHSKRAPARMKAQEEYLLQGKCFCGICGAPMIGESGRSGTGRVYHYYTCANRKKYHNCKKSNERKDDLEQYVITKTVMDCLTAGNINALAGRVVEEYRASREADPTAELETRLRQINMDIEKLVDSLLDLPKAAHKSIGARIELLEREKEDVQTEIIKLNLITSTRITEASVTHWLSSLIPLGSAAAYPPASITQHPAQTQPASQTPNITNTPPVSENAAHNGDPFVKKYTESMDPITARKTLINIFINSVYVDDDSITIMYNLSNNQTPPPGTKEINTKLSASTPTSNSSDMTATAPPYQSKSEPHLIVIGCVFGFVFARIK